jgi:hypothetical protein
VAGTELLEKRPLDILLKIISAANSATGAWDLTPNLLKAGLQLAILILVISATNAEAKQLVLTCQITQGASEPYRSAKILIDEDAGIVVYDFNEKFGVKLKLESKDCNGCYADLSMKITMKNEKVLVANNTTSAFVMTKHDGKFVHSFVTPLPLPDGNYAALGNTLWGACAKSPFN